MLLLRTPIDGVTDFMLFCDHVRINQKALVAGTGRSPRRTLTNSPKSKPCRAEKRWTGTPRHLEPATKIRHFHPCPAMLTRQRPIPHCLDTGQPAARTRMRV